MELYPETNTQFLARMVLATHEGDQISSQDAKRLADLAQFGPHGRPTTMPEEHHSGNKKPELVK